MTRTNKTPGQADPDVGASSVRRASSRVPVDGAAVSLDEPLLDCEAAAALLNVRVSWVRDAARLGQLPCLRVGRHLRWKWRFCRGHLATSEKAGSSGGTAITARVSTRCAGWADRSELGLPQPPGRTPQC
jgi:hypothetical protein